MSKKPNGPDLKVKIKTDLWFLEPCAPTEPSQDTIIEGTVELSLHKPKKVTKLDVELVRAVLSGKKVN